MSEVTKALEKSIQHWKENLAAESPHQASTGAEDCALCTIYLGDWPSICVGCPVSSYTGQRGCHNSPYYLADKAFNKWEEAFNSVGESPWAKSVACNTDAVKTARNNFRTHARDEIEFLEMLLARERINEVQAP